MVLNVSGRTDIVAFYSDWFMNRIKEGFVDVRNPFNKKLVSRIYFEDVDLILFCTKNPIPILDKIEKIGKQSVIEELKKINVDSNAIEKIIDFIEISGTTDEKLSKLKELKIENENFNKGLEELQEVVKYIRIFGIPDSNFKVDLTIARGLDYYTGTVYETFLDNYRELGSVCSGGRYENLAEYYTDKKLPGVGISIGLTRLFYKLNELNLIKADKKSISDILIIPMVENLEVPIKIATKLRNLGINTEIYLNNKKLKAKFKYADKLKIPFTIIIGEDEINSNTITLKNMETGEENRINMDEIDSIKEMYNFKEI